MNILTKEEFSKLSLEEQIEYYNKNMALGKSAAIISREIEINESTPRKKFAKHGYRLNKEKNRYILVNDDKCMTLKKTSHKAVNDKRHTSLIKSKEIINGTNSSINTDDNSKLSVINLNDDNNNTLVINDKFKKNLLNLAEDYDDLKDMLEWFKNKDDNNNTSVIEIVQGITIDLPGTENIRTTIRINKKIWEAFDKFCNDNSHLSKQDIHGMALKEYMDKYKKEK